MSIVDFCVGFILSVYFTLLFAYFLSIILNALPPRPNTPATCLLACALQAKQAGRAWGQHPISEVAEYVHI